MGNLVNQVTTAYQPQIDALNNNLVLLANQLTNDRNSLVAAQAGLNNILQVWADRQAKYAQDSADNRNNNKGNKYNSEGQKINASFTADSKAIQGAISGNQTNVNNVQAWIDADNKAIAQNKANLDSVTLDFNDKLKSAQNSEDISAAQTSANAVNQAQATNPDIIAIRTAAETADAANALKIAADAATAQAADAQKSKVITYIVVAVVIVIVVTVLGFVIFKSSK